MDLVVKEMSEVSIPNDLLKKIDMASLIKDFKSDFGQLDNLKEARKTHEDRNAFSRWWYSDELEGAQLDAAELQASFSKKIGQLMVLSIKQSKLLTQQQQDLQQQQNIIKQQAEDLSLANVQLDEQQQKQLQQQEELQTLIDNYFALKGLTAKEAEKLILIANEVKDIKNTIFEKLELEIATITDLKESLLHEFHTEVCEFDKKLQSSDDNFESKLTDVSEQFSQNNDATSSQVKLLKVDIQLIQNKYESEFSKQQDILATTSEGLSSLKLKSEENQRQFQVTTTHKNKQLKMLTIGLVTSFLISATSLGIIIYPMLAK
jgi:hypothetical protein